MKMARILPGVLLWSVAACAQLRSGMLESLVRNSPFGAPQDGMRPAEVGPVRFEFHGVMAEAGNYSFCVYDQSRHRADWVKLNEPGRIFVARRFDQARGTLVIEHNGQALTLALKRAQVQAMAVTPPVASPPPLPTTGVPAQAPAAGIAPPPPGANATNAAEAQRLQDIVDEIRHRRGLRQMPPAENPPRKP
jgi:hypothetical protein